VTPDEIRNAPHCDHETEMESWLREIAAQLAEHAEIARKMLVVYERAWPEVKP
jgi:hypothetical protein